MIRRFQTSLDDYEKKKSITEIAMMKIVILKKTATSWFWFYWFKCRSWYLSAVQDA